MIDTNGKILIIGANSAIAKEVARNYAAKKWEIYLIGRNKHNLNSLADDLRVRGASKVSCSIIDLSVIDENIDAVVQAAFVELEDVDVVLVAHGSLPNQLACESDFYLTQNEFNVNALSVIAILHKVATLLEEKGHGTIAAITSVAGDRGRQSNYVYGSAKAMVSTYLQGLRGRLFSRNVHVTEIRPGFVDTPMTANIEKGPLWVGPEVVAKIIVHAISKKRHTVYAPFYWRIIMMIIKLIPDSVFKRTKF